VRKVWEAITNGRAERGSAGASQDGTRRLAFCQVMLLSFSLFLRSLSDSVYRDLLAGERASATVSKVGQPSKKVKKDAKAELPKSPKRVASGSNQQDDKQKDLRSFFRRK
jgi:hypothetical protein